MQSLKEYLHNQEMEIATDPALSSKEKETSVTFPNDTDTGLFYTEVPTMIKWVLSIEESKITDYRTVEDKLVAVKAEIPKGIVKFQSNARKSNTHGQMVSYGPNKE